MTTSTAEATRVFDRVVCGIDGSVQALEAARQARQVVAPEGTLRLVSVIGVTADPVAPYGARATPSAVEREAERRLRLASDACGNVPAELLVGTPTRRLPQALRDLDATLVAVGAKGNGRAAGLLLGSVTSALLRNAPCSVLVARPAPAGALELIVAGTDGSEAAERAVTAARELAGRTGAVLRVLAAGSEPLRGRTDVEHDDRPPLLALVEASKDADLIVVGSRGLRGLRALGSVSERVGHDASCSVLVVR